MTEVVGGMFATMFFIGLFVTFLEGVWRMFNQAISPGWLFSWVCLVVGFIGMIVVLWIEGRLP